VGAHGDWLGDYVKRRRPDLPARPIDIPKGPDTVYRNKGWTNWGDWLGTGVVASQMRGYMSFEEVRANARTSSNLGRNGLLTAQVISII